MNVNRKYSTLYSNFIGIDKKSLTLRERLIPHPQTEQYLAENWPVFRDDERTKKYPIVKDVLDREHKKLINRGLERLTNNRKIEWDELGELIETGIANKKEIDEEKKKIRHVISDELMGDSVFESLFGKKAFGKKGYLITADLTDEEKEAVDEFDGFSVYLKNFNENRKNVYSPEDIGTAVGYRIVDENFTKFVINKKIYKRIVSEVPEIKQIFADEAANKNIEWNEGIFLYYDKMNDVLTQEAIDNYNNIIGVVNLVTNLYVQKNIKSIKDDSVFSKRRNYKMLPMFKQILSDRTARFGVEAYENDNEVISELEELAGILNDDSEDGLKDQLRSLATDMKTASLEGVYFDGKSLPKVSIWLEKKWDFIEGILIDYYRSKMPENEKRADEKIEAIMKAKAFALSDIVKAVEKYNSEISKQAKEEDISLVYFDQIWDFLINKVGEADLKYQGFKTFIKSFDYSVPLQQIEISAIKEYLDIWMEILHFIKSFIIKDENSVTLSEEFYVRICDVMNLLRDYIGVYNKTRNYITKKPFSTEKYLLKFDNPTLGDGWSKDKEREYGTILLRKNGKYYLAIFNPKNKPVIKDNPDLKSNYYEKLVYSLFKDSSKMIPKCSTQLKDVKKHFEGKTDADDMILSGENFVEPLVITQEIFDLNNKTYNGKKKWQKEYAKQDPEGYREATEKWSRFCIDFAKKYRSTACYDFSEIKDATEYDSVADLYHDFDKMFYNVSFARVSECDIQDMLDNNQIFLFQIYNKDFSDNKRAGTKKNLHTLYWEALFSEENIRERVLMLNGGMELFKRPASIKNPVKHKAGSMLINKITKNHVTIPDHIYMELKKRLTYDEKGNIVKGAMSKEAEEFYSRYSKEICIQKKKYDIVKDKRYTEDQFFVHVPITINFTADGMKQLNLNILKKLQETISKGEDIHLIGLDRGERNLIAYSVIDLDGKIIAQGTFNSVNNVDYQDKLTKKQNARTEQRKNWNTIENIKNMKEGYVSLVIHELTKLMEEYNAVVFMEDLNFGFKRGRFKMEKQVYQKFEMALLNKLQYLVTSKEEGDDMLIPGGVLKGYQLTTAPQSLRDVGHQCGIVFYVPPAYTSKIDPTTGFADIFDYRKLTNAENRKKFFWKFESIFYDKDKDCFAFEFDFKNFDVYMSFAKTRWVVFSDEKGEKGKHVYDPKDRKTVKVNTTEGIKALLEGAGINYKDENLKEKILMIDADHDNASFWKSLDYYFRIVMRLRDSVNIKNSDGTETVIDRIISPVRNYTGERFVTPLHVSEDDRKSPLPVDADGNGAYHIALKGLYLLKNKLMKTEIKEKIPTDFYKITHPEWFNYMQTIKNN